MSNNMISVALAGLDWDIIDLIESIPTFKFMGIFDKENHAGIDNVCILGKDADWARSKLSYPDLRVILAVDLPELRKSLFKHYGQESIIGAQSPHSYISTQAIIAQTAVIQRGVTIMPKAKIGVGCKLHLNVTVHHEVQIADFCTIGPGAQLLGNVRIAENTYIGAGAIIKQRCTIGPNATVGAGAVVVKDVLENTTVVGVPANRIL